MKTILTTIALSALIAAPAIGRPGRVTDWPVYCYYFDPAGRLELIDYTCSFSGGMTANPSGVELQTSSRIITDTPHLEINYGRGLDCDPSAALDGVCGVSRYRSDQFPFPFTQPSGSALTLTCVATPEREVCVQFEQWLDQ